MSFLAKLFLDGSETKLLSANLHVHQPIDRSDRPSANPRGGLITINLPSTRDNTLLEWMVTPNMAKNGYIRFYNHDGMRKKMDWEFWDCFCVHYDEVFSDTGNQPMSIQMVLSPGILRYNSVIFQKSWSQTKVDNLKIMAPTTNLDPVATAKDDINPVPKVKNQFYTDRNDNPLPEIKQGDKIFLVLETENLTGETIDVDLADKEVDFLYKNKRLENDILQGYTINSDLEKIPLEVIPEEHEEY